MSQEDVIKKPTLTLPNRYFLSYKFTGIPIERLFEEIDPIRAKVEGNGHEFFCNLYDDENYQKYKLTPKQIMNHALSELDRSTHCLVYISENFGGGSAIEVGWALARGIPVIALVNNQIEESMTSLMALADKVIRFKNDEDLYNKLDDLVEK